MISYFNNIRGILKAVSDDYVASRWSRSGSMTSAYNITKLSYRVDVRVCCSASKAALCRLFCASENDFNALAISLNACLFDRTCFNLWWGETVIFPFSVRVPHRHHHCHPHFQVPHRHYQYQLQTGYFR